MTEVQKTDAQKKIAQEMFLRAHIHLIVPLLFTPAERMLRDQALLRQNWDRQTGG